MKPTRAALLLALFALLVAPAGPAAAQSLPGWGRFSLFGQYGRSNSDGGGSLTYSDLQAAFTLRSATGGDDAGMEYAIDSRGSSYGATDRTNRLYLYDAWVGGRLSGTVTARVGQMWLNDLGALGAVGGILAEVHPQADWAIGRPRIGIFGGLEPEAFDVGYAQGVKKYGGYLAVDGEGARRHVLGYVTIRNQGLVERSVVSMTNFIPVGREFFLYQSAEFDLVGPGGADGGKGLNYFFVNARWAPVTRLEFQAVFHRGRSIDTRTITQDQIDGRPVSPSALQGLLYESIGGRITLEIAKNVRVFGGYAQDRNNSGDAATGRISAGIWAYNLVGSGFDLTVSDNRYQQPGGTSYDGWYASLGRTIGSRAYLSVDYSTALSVLRILGEGGVTVESRPRSRRYALSGNVNVSRVVSVLLTAERLRDDTSTQDRGLLGLSFRF